MKVAIIGAGVSGLASARQASEHNVDFVVFEATDSIGGTWVYSEEVPADEYNVPVHASIYQSLRVNLPTQLMEFTGYKFEPESGSCYPGHEEVLKYIKDFAKEFYLNNHIKFHHQVQRISKDQDGWKITAKNLKNNQINDEYFDAVMICTGHHAKPLIPHIPGIETFEGDQIHSYKYRKNAPFANKRILIIGQGPSGLDISMDCAEVAEKVYLSCRSQVKANIVHEKVESKPGILTINSNSVTFTDETTVQVDSVILCTGYEFHFPFLDKSCEIIFEENHIVRPLFKRFINIHHPTMCFICLVVQSLVFPLVDLQARVFLKHLTGQISLPSTDTMLLTEIQEHTKKVEANLPAAKYHLVGAEMKAYMTDLASFGQTERLPEVHFKIYHKNKEISLANYQNQKKQTFKIVDDKSYLWELK